MDDELRIIDALAKWVCGPDQSRAEQVMTLSTRDDRHHRIAPSVLSAWDHAGVATLPATSRSIVTLMSEKVQRLGDLGREIMCMGPGTYGVKGAGISASYPAHIVRSQNDADFVATGLPELFAVVDGLTSRQFSVVALTVAAHRGRVHSVVELERRRPDGQSDLVEISTVPAWGDLVGVPPSLLCSAVIGPAVRNMALLVEERLHRKFRARDLLDVWMLVSTARGELDRLWPILDDRTLWPEWAELRRLLTSKLSFDPGGPSGSELRRLVRSSSRIRRCRAAENGRAGWVGFGLQLQGKVVQGRSNRHTLRALKRVERSVSPLEALTAGTLMFGHQVSSEIGQFEFDLARWPARVATPVGHFSLSLCEGAS